MIIRSFTVWRFTSASTGEERVVARVSEPQDARYQHEYQKVLWQGSAVSPTDALFKYAAS